MVLRQNVSDDVYGTFCVESGKQTTACSPQRGLQAQTGAPLRHAAPTSPHIVGPYSQRVVEFPRAVLVHVGRVGQVFVGRGNVDVFPAKHGLPDVQRRLQLHSKEGA